MTVPVDEATIRDFVTIISSHVGQIVNGSGSRGVLQLSQLSPVDEKLVPTRFRPDDIDGVVRAAVGAANANLNAYIEGRLVRPGLRGNARGGLGDTEAVFALVIDSDNDKGKGGVLAIKPSMTIETSRRNAHHWLLLDRLITARRGKALGDAIRNATGADHATGVVTQCYRVAGTPNFPGKAKQARGRTTVEPTRIVEWTGRLWDPAELEAIFAGATTSAPASPTMAAAAVEEASLPDELLQIIRNGGVSAGAGDKTRSGEFHKVVGELKKRKWSAEAIIALLVKYPGGVAAKYAGRIPDEVERSYRKVEKGSGVNGPVQALGSPPAAAAGSGGGSGPSGGGGPQAASAAPSQGPAAAPRVLPTIRIRDGQLTRVLKETEQAILAAGLPVFVRAGHLVRPVSDKVRAADNRWTLAARLRLYKPHSLVQQVAKAAIFQRYNVRSRSWVDVDPPLQFVQMLLEREGEWVFPRVMGVIVTPTLRPDGSLLEAPGYDPETELYLMPGLTLPTIPQSPTREDALAALAFLKELFSEFSFKHKNPAIDRSVALAGALTSLLRGSLPTAPMFLVKGSAPGVGKSCLVDVISTIATGRVCPVLTAGRSAEETEKRIGAVLLDGRTIVSLDNLVHNLDGELICQMTERPVVSIRILGLSESPDCECRVSVFATGNNVDLRGDLVRRGLLIELEALSARPELRKFKSKVLKRAALARTDYVAAALTIARAYIAAGRPEVCGPFGSYSEWSEMVRAPLVWLGEPDPCDSIEEIRREDEVLTDILAFFVLLLIHLKVGQQFTTARLIEIADQDANRPNNFNPPDLRNFLLKVAASRTKAAEVSPERLGRWLRRISGRPVLMPGTNPSVQRRLVREQGHGGVVAFRLTIVPEDE